MFHRSFCRTVSRASFLQNKFWPAAFKTREFKRIHRTVLRDSFFSFQRAIKISEQDSPPNAFLELPREYFSD